MHADPLASSEAEAAVLGSMILEPDCIDKVLGIMPNDALYYPEHRAMFDAIITARDKHPLKDGKIDLIPVGEELKRVGETDVAHRLFAIVESLPTSANAEYYATIVKKKALVRQLREAGEEIGGLVSDQTDIADKIESAKEIIGKLETGKKEDIKQLKTILPEAVEQMDEGDKGLETGFSKLDWLLCGLQPADYIIVAARPSIGKTALAMSMAANMVAAGNGVLFVSLEMTGIQLAKRLICSQAKVSMHTARQGKRSGMISNEDLHSLINAGNQMCDWPLYISQSSMLTPSELARQVRTQRRIRKIDCVIVDYLQLMHVPGKKESRQQEITTISRQLKSLALAEEIPFVVLSQLSRGVEYRENKRPRLADLRDSGSIEQDADVVMFLYREDYYHKDEQDYEPDNIAELIIRKNRQGDTGTIKLMFHPKFVSFNELQRGYENYAQV